MVRTPLIAANWKMNAPPQGWDEEQSPYRTPVSGADVIVFPSSLDIPACIEKFLVTGGQCARPEEAGAFTGDISMRMLANHGCKYVLCGHSERRIHHHETNAYIAEQAAAAMKTGLMPVICIGETADEREMGNAEKVIEEQVKTVLAHEGFTAHSSFIIAYEPVWAIGTGKTASAQDAQNMHAFIRSLLPNAQKETTNILYGGSVKPTNAAELIAQDDIDGFLVGGASLEPASFRAIVDSCTGKA